LQRVKNLFIYSGTSAVGIERGLEIVFWRGGGRRWVENWGTSSCGCGRSGTGEHWHTCQFWAVALPLVLGLMVLELMHKVGGTSGSSGCSGGGGSLGSGGGLFVGLSIGSNLKRVDLSLLLLLIRF
jgi:hypothetical protein